jgi:hypothetical protein
MRFPYNEKVKVTSVQYRMEVYHEGFVFVVYIGEYNRTPVIENLRILTDKNEWRNIKYSVKQQITTEVHKIAQEWILQKL